MAITVSLASRGKNRLRYLIAFDGVAGTGVAINMATAPGKVSLGRNISEDARGGILEKLARASELGYGAIPAGAINADKAKALWESDYSGVSVGQDLSIAENPTATLQVTRKSGLATSPDLSVTTGVTEDEAVISLSVPAASDVVGAWYLDVSVPGAIGP